MIHSFEERGLASESEFAAGLRKQSPDDDSGLSGVPLCCRGGSVYTDDSDSHTLIFGNTGTKKTRNFCIPSVFTLGSAGESMVISDPKGEIYRSTSGYLAERGYNIKVLNLRDPEKGSKWNPLLLPYRYYKNGDKDKAIELISDLAMQLKAQVHSDRDLYWENQAMDLLMGLILMLFECETDEKKVHMESIQRIRVFIELEDKSEAGNVFWELIKSFPANSLVRYKLASIYALRTTDKTLPCIISTFDSMVRSFIFNKKIMQMLDSSEIDFDSLAKERSALYIITPDEKTTFHFLVSVFVKQCYEYLIEYAQKSPGGILPKRMNFILDEFSNFPKISDMPSMISAARSRNIRFVLVVQSNQQLLSNYGDDSETIKSNCRNWIYLSCRELSLLKEIRELCGTVYHNGAETYVFSISQLQRLTIGREDSQALILRPASAPYISWVKDFTAYPQASYGELPIPERKFRRTECFSAPKYLQEKLKITLNKEAEDLDMDALFTD